QCKLQVSFNPRTDLDLSVIHESLIQSGAAYKPGQGPMVHMERILHTKLTQLEDTMMGRQRASTATWKFVARRGEPSDCIDDRRVTSHRGPAHFSYYVCPIVHTSYCTTDGSSDESYFLFHACFDEYARYCAVDGSPSECERACFVVGIDSIAH
ncbi:unnamed protein product, partial [Prorocentrum cordatum]